MGNSSNPRWYWLTLIFILLVLAAIAWGLLRLKLNDDLTDLRKIDEQQIQLIASILSTKIDSGQYQDIEKFLNEWAATNKDILALRLDSDNGFNLGSYRSPVVESNFIELKSHIKYSYHGNATFNARMNLEGVYQRNNKLGLQILGLFFVFGTMTFFLLHMAIQRQYAARRTQHLSNLYKALSEVNQAIVRMDQQAEIFPLICRCAVDFGGMCMAWVGLVDEENELIKPVASYGKNNEILQSVVISSRPGGHEGQGPVSTAVRENRHVIINGSSALPTLMRQSSKEFTKLCKSTAAFPIPKAGNSYAVLQVYSPLPEGFNKEEIALLDEMTRDISFALDNFEREIQRTEAEKSLQLAASVYAASSEGILITDASNRIISVNPAFTNITGYLPEEAIGNDPNILNSGRHDSSFYQSMWGSIESTGKWSGEIWDKHKNGKIYPKWLTIDTIHNADRSVLHRVAMFTDISKQKEDEDKILHLAFYDPLTNLPNRQLLIDRMQQAIASSSRTGREGALLFIDLDNFKNINDTLGHDIGDMLLQQVTQRLQFCLRECDTVARLGGDEFVVMLVDLSEQYIEAASQTKAIGEKILTALNQIYHLDKYDYRSSASIGATLFNNTIQDSDELMKQADIAMYQAKKAGRNALRFFDQQMQESITARVLLENELHAAIESQQFHLYYQIQVDSAFRPLGAEALIRWIHPVKGLISPIQFIPLAEEIGLILPIGEWVLNKACAQLKLWQEAPHTRGLALAINVSAKQFHQTDFLGQVKTAVQNFAINPGLLKLELTESLLQESIEDTIAIMTALSNIGIKFSLDDFGTGYSSLQYLKRLPLDQIKIDQSFVRDITADSTDLAVVRATIAMAQSLKLEVIAEGVETETQRKLLLENGCTCFQGYLFSKPLSIEKFEEILKQK